MGDLRNKYDLDGQPQRIEPVSGHKPPRELRPTPPAEIPTGEDPDALRKDIENRLEEHIGEPEQPKQTIKERAMKAILNQLLAFFRTWLYGRPVYKTHTNPVTGEVEFVRDKDGNKVVNKPLTVLGRAMQVVGALGLLTSVVFGKTVAEWGELLKTILSLFV